MADARARGPFSSPRVSVTSISVECHLECKTSSADIRSAKPGGNTTPPGSRGATDSHKRLSNSGGALPAGASPLGRPSQQARATSSPMAPNASFPPSRPSVKQALAQQQLLVSPTSRSSRAKIAPEGLSGTLDEISGSGPLVRTQLPPGSPLAATPNGSFRASRVWDAVPRVEQPQPQSQHQQQEQQQVISSLAHARQLQPPQHQLTVHSRTASASLNGMAAALGGGGPAAGAHLISSPSFKASAAPAGPGVVVVKDAVKLVVHHYRASDDSDEGDDADASRQNSAASDGEPAQPRGPQGPQVSGLVRFLAVLCCMAPAKPQHKKRRRRSRKPSALSSEVLAPEEHLIGAHQNVTDFKGKYQRAQAKAQALVPVPAIKRCASNAGFALPSPSAGDPSGHYGTSISGTGTEDARTVSGGSRPPHQPSLVSPFATQSVPNGGSPVTRTASMRSPGDVRLLGGMRSSPLQSQSVDGYMDVVGWSPVGTAGGGVAGGSGSGRALSGGSPQAYTGSMFVAGDSGGGLSRISSFDGSCPSGQLPAETAEPSSRLVQCLKLELVAGASSSLDGAGSMTPEALTERHQERTVTGSSVNGYGKRGVRWQ